MLVAWKVESTPGSQSNGANQGEMSETVVMIAVIPENAFWLPGMDSNNIPRFWTRRLTPSLPAYWIATCPLDPMIQAATTWISAVPAATSAGKRKLTW